MPNPSYPAYTPSHGYMTEKIQQKYIAAAIKDKKLPENAHRMPEILTLNASVNPSKPLQFWQLYSVLGEKRIVRIVQNFYQRVYRDGGGFKYHGAEFRLNFHHQHNAIELMNKKGAERWIKLMVQTLDDTTEYMTDDPRVRISLNTFLTYFTAKYAADFGFQTHMMFGVTNAPMKRKLNFMNMPDSEIEALPEAELREALVGRGVHFSEQADKSTLINLAKRL